MLFQENIPKGGINWEIDWDGKNFISEISMEIFWDAAQKLRAYGSES